MTPTLFSYRLLTLVLCTGFVCGACGKIKSGGALRSIEGIRVDLDQGNERELLAYYFGGMVSPRGGDAFENGLVREEDGEYFLDVEKIAERVPQVESGLRAAGEDGLIEWEELEPIVAGSYYSYRPIPRSVDALRERYGDWRDESTWFGFKVDGVMSPNTRHIRVPLANLKEAISLYQEKGQRVIYPEGTTFISEDVQDNQIIELSVMTRRSDGFWDFYAYGSDGQQLTIVERTPTDLIVPTRCVGCHFGNRLFEPERSFPVDPPPGPMGPRLLHVSETMRRVDVITRIDEHRKRSDSILGLYATLFISEMQSRRANGSLDPSVEEALTKAGF